MKIIFAATCTILSAMAMAMLLAFCAEYFYEWNHPFWIDTSGGLMKISRVVNSGLSGAVLGAVIFLAQYEACSCPAKSFWGKLEISIAVFFLLLFGITMFSSSWDDTVCIACASLFTVIHGVFLLTLRKKRSPQN